MCDAANVSKSEHGSDTYADPSSKYTDNLGCSHKVGADKTDHYTFECYMWVDSEVMSEPLLGVKLRP